MKTRVLKVSFCIVSLFLIISCGGGGKSLDEAVNNSGPEYAHSPSPNEDEQTGKPVPPIMLPQPEGQDIVEYENNEWCHEEELIEEGSLVDVHPICIESDEPDAMWWLAYQLTGGLIQNMDLRFEEDLIEETGGGTMYYFNAALPDAPDDVILDLAYFIGSIEEKGNYIIFSHNVTWKYHDLTYADPVFGDVTVDGTVKCTGKNVYYPVSGHRHDFYTCRTAGKMEDYANQLTKSTGGLLSFSSITGENLINFIIKKNFEGIDYNALENYSFTGKISIDHGDGVEVIDLPEKYHIPDEISRCLNQ